MQLPLVKNYILKPFDETLKENVTKLQIERTSAVENASFDSSYFNLKNISAALSLQHFETSFQLPGDQSPPIIFG